MTSLRLALAVGCLLIGLSGTPARSQSTDSLPCAGVRFLPAAILVPALLANPQEARVGVRKEVGSSRLKLDIGTSMDLIAFTIDSGGSSIATGIDFFTYALTTSSEGFRLQVDAVDGFFGGHVSFSFPGRDASYEVRLRLLHLSAHFVDGHYDLNSGSWRDNRSPLPFTRDFGEILGTIRIHLGGFPLRVYSGFSYATLVRPAEIGRFATLCGLELSSSEIVPAVLGSRTSLYFACNLTLAAIPSYAGTAAIETGVKFGPTYGRGVRIYGGFTSGPEIFSQYYDLRRTAWGLGFAFDAW